MSLRPLRSCDGYRSGAVRRGHSRQENPIVYPVFAAMRPGAPIRGTGTCAGMRMPHPGRRTRGSRDMRRDAHATWRTATRGNQDMRRDARATSRMADPGDGDMRRDAQATSRKATRGSRDMRRDAQATWRTATRGNREADGRGSSVRAPPSGSWRTGRSRRAGSSPVRRTARRTRSAGWRRPSRRSRRSARRGRGPSSP